MSLFDLGPSTALTLVSEGGGGRGILASRVTVGFKDFVSLKFEMSVRNGGGGGGGGATAATSAVDSCITDPRRTVFLGTELFTDIFTTCCSASCILSIDICRINVRVISLEVFLSWTLAYIISLVNGIKES